MNPTDEQNLTVRAAVTMGRFLKVRAGAGTGKTSTLVLTSRAFGNRRIGYIAFNKAVQVEGERKFDRNVRCRTAHGLAFVATGAHRINERLEGRGRGLYGGTIRDFFGKERILYNDANRVREALLNFCHSLDEIPGAQHFHPSVNLGTRNALVPFLRDVWKDITDWESGKLIVPHDAYLKLWQLQKPNLSGQYDVIFFDEAQDADPVMLDIVLNCGVPVIFVGDPDQSIYRFRGAVNAMELIDAPMLSLTQSFRFGQSIADVANAILGHKPSEFRSDFRLSGNPKINSTVITDKLRKPSGPYAVICRTNSGAFRWAVDNPGVPIHIVGGVEDTIRVVTAAHDLYRGRKPPASIQSIARFNTWEALEKYAKDDTEDDPEIKFVYRLVREYAQKGEEAFLKLLEDVKNRQVPQSDMATITIGTGHKVKGLEFDYVVLNDDFVTPYEMQEGEWKVSERWQKMSAIARTDEIRLAYVAATRAKSFLKVNEAVLAFMRAPQPIASQPDHEPVRREERREAVDVGQNPLLAEMLKM